MAVLSISDLSLAFGHVPLLDHAAMALEAGERVGLIGRNGTGKSSLLKIIAGLEQPDAGLVQVQQGLRQVYVPQEASFPAEATVFDTVAHGVAEARDLRARYEAHSPDDDLDAIQTRIELLDGWTWEQRVDQTLQRLELQAEARIESLSGGMQKRVALARAIASEPAIMFFDEPTTGLDPIMGAVIDELIVDCVKRLGSTSIAITHDMASAQRIGDRAAMLYEGRVCWTGAADELLTSTDPVVDQFTHGRAHGPIKMALRR